MARSAYLTIVALSGIWALAAVVVTAMTAAAAIRHSKKNAMGHTDWNQPND